MKKGTNKDKNFLCNINALGTLYSVYITTTNENNYLKNRPTVAGYCNYATESIYLNIDKIYNLKMMKEYFRHEVTHAFFNESGLSSYCKYATSEQYVDWIAMQSLKIISVFNSLKLLDEKYSIDNLRINLKKIDILGSEYKIYYRSENEESFNEGSSLYSTRSKIILLNKDYEKQMIEIAQSNPIKFIQLYGTRNQLLRFQILSIFMMESGLDEECIFSNDNEAIEWLSIQFPKMTREFSLIDIFSKHFKFNN